MYLINQPEIDYMDVANELGNFLINDVNEDIISGIVLKLQSSLEMLRRHGYPIDRLRAEAQNPISSK